MPPGYARNEAGPPSPPEPLSKMGLFSSFCDCHNHKVLSISVTSTGGKKMTDHKRLRFRLHGSEGKRSRNNSHTRTDRQHAGGRRLTTLTAAREIENEVRLGAEGCCQRRYLRWAEAAPHRQGTRKVRQEGNHSHEGRGLQAAGEELSRRGGHSR